MKNLDKIITNILILTWVGLSCSILKADPSCGDGVCNGDESYDTCPDDCNIVITEIFILTPDNIPPYIEFYNNSNDSVSLEGWTIKIREENLEELYPIANGFSILQLPSNNFVINPHDYYIISSTSCNKKEEFPFGCNDGFFHNDLT